ncbi:MAG TPA: patatin-like phospholipase family protein [Chitinophagaceae bacterium]
MKAYIKGFYYSLPVQLLFLHFRKYQVLIAFWLILFGVVNGGFMKTFGADSLYLAPEYLGYVNSFSFAIVGISIGMFIMSWNITTFIMFSRHFKFLATTSNPFLKYCINNSVIPIFFLLFYFFKAYHFDKYKELIGTTEIFFLAGGFLSGLMLILIISFLYFFSADKNIFRQMQPILEKPEHLQAPTKKAPLTNIKLLRVEWYIDSFFRRRRVRDVSHYTTNFLESIFKRHHFAAVISVVIAFIFLIGIGFFLEYKFFQIPAAASITVFFAVLIGVSGAFAYFLQSWSVPYLILLVIALNFLYKWDLIDPRNKAYGLNYHNKSERPLYDSETLRKMSGQERITEDSLNMIGILENWRKKQITEKPLLVVVATSGGGSRSATFTMNILQQLDSVTKGGLMQKTFLITGASGGMLGASYYRELYLQKQKGKQIDLYDNKYVDDISGDLLNPVFSSFVARDLISPAQKFSVGPYQYIKDRAYAFEEKLASNTRGYLNKKLGDYRADEHAANIPLMFFNSVVTRDARRMIISTQPVSFMMQPLHNTGAIGNMEPDAIDFTAFFKKQNPYNLRILSALRMNATFPIVLPNVWLPSNPIIDVMDGGLRDNYGQETAMRFLNAFEDWIKMNTRGVLIIQLRDRDAGGWDYPYLSDNIAEQATKPFLILQHNWSKMMEYYQNDMLTYYAQHAGFDVSKVIFQYASGSAESRAALNFHLTKSEKRDIFLSMKVESNVKSFQRVQQLFQQPVTPVPSKAE